MVDPAGRKEAEHAVGEVTDRSVAAEHRDGTAGEISVGPG